MKELRDRLPQLRGKTPAISSSIQECLPQLRGTHRVVLVSDVVPAPLQQVYYRAFPSSLAGHALKWFNKLPEGCITSFKEHKKRFIRTYIGRVQQDKDEHSPMTIRQRENETISSFQDRFQTEFNLVPGGDQTTAIISFTETRG
ncbi:hypothetical protein LIER_10263 [Lithospermum erythrorhizon]|uniref:Retrotransposon gag domain-containing protein n=1 Tax=Lithospermum erythrorhizon TaxID=34254 RepID=A0AAV3PIJ8_LITER